MVNPRRSYAAEVKVLTSLDGNFEEAAWMTWMAPDMSGNEPSFEETIMFAAPVFKTTHESPGLQDTVVEGQSAFGRMCDRFARLAKAEVKFDSEESSSSSTEQCSSPEAEHLKRLREREVGREVFLRPLPLESTVDDVREMVVSKCGEERS
eukprot:s308_g13.t1